MDNIKLQDTITTVYNNFVEKVLQVYEVFKDYFGELRVDLQDIIDATIKGAEIENLKSIEDENILKECVKNIFVGKALLLGNPKIYVYWPTVKVENEFNKYTVINELYAKVELNYTGQLDYSFQLNRANYTYSHFINGYMHSHISSIPKNDFTVFQNPCLGRGPIVFTTHTLRRNFDLDIWGLFCRELDNYVHVESIKGGPYHRLEQADNIYNNRHYYNKFQYSLIDTRYKYKYNIDWSNFVKYVIEQKVLKFGYSNNHYILSTTVADTTLLLSNLFIKWINSKKSDSNLVNLESLLHSGILKKGCYSGGVLYIIRDSDQIDVKEYIGKQVLTFKGKPITITIEGAPTDNNAMYFLNQDIINKFVTTILAIVNYRYGKERTNTTNPATPKEVYL